MTSREVIKLLERNGWTLIRIAGSHHQFRHIGRPGIVTVPHPKADLAIGTLKSIEKQSGLNLRKA